MSSYQPLADHLATRKGSQWDASFEEIEQALGRPLPQSAYRYNAWWANQTGPGHSQTHGWRSVGWRTSKLDLERRRVRFEREGPLTKKAEPSQSANPGLYERAHRLSGIEDRQSLIEEALRALIEREAAAHLIAVGGTMPDLAVPVRERPEP